MFWKTTPHEDYPIRFVSYGDEYYFKTHGDLNRFRNDNKHEGFVERAKREQREKREEQEKLGNWFQDGHFELDQERKERKMEERKMQAEHDRLTCKINCAYNLDCYADLDLRELEIMKIMMMKKSPLLNPQKWMLNDKRFSGYISPKSEEE
jgi:hypothetical protein